MSKLLRLSITIAVSLFFLIEGVSPVVFPDSALIALADEGLHKGQEKKPHDDEGKHKGEDEHKDKDKDEHKGKK